MNIGLANIQNGNIIFDKISVMEAVNPGRSRPVILIKISSVLLFILCGCYLHIAKVRK